LMIMMFPLVNHLIIGTRRLQFPPKDIHERNMSRKLQAQLSATIPENILDPSVSRGNAMLEVIRSRNRSKKTTSTLYPNIEGPLSYQKWQESMSFQGKDRRGTGFY
jgi:hypothetical protein